VSASQVRRIGMIGAGWVTGYHLPAWGRQRHRAEVVAIADPSSEAAARRAAEFGIPRTYASAEQMLDAEQLDAVDICSPRETHAAMIRLAAGRQLDILCQKPLGTDFAEAEAVVARVAPPTRLMVHENWRFRAYYRRAAQWLMEGRIGAVKAASLNLVTSGTVPGADGRYAALDRQPFMRTESRMLVAEVLIHHLDTLRFLLGSMTVNAAALSRTNPEMAGEDTAVIHLQTSHGVGVAVFATFAAHGAPTEQRDQLTILGEHGTIRLDGAELSIAGAQNERIAFDQPEVYLGSYAATIAHFVSSLRDGTPFETSTEDNLQTLRIVEDCYRLSGRSGA
jgi:predicted dehydrogenase